MDDVLIGLDIGTTNIKAAAYSAQGTLIASASAPVEILSPHPGWAEQDAEAWWLAVQTVLQRVCTNVGIRRIVALGLSGQCPGHVLVSSDRGPVGPAIIWRDQRATEEAGWIEANISPEQALRWTGSPHLGNATSPPARLLWMSRHRAGDLAAASAVLQPKDYIAWRLTGAIATDVHSAYNLFDPLNNFYHPEYFRTLGFPLELLPPVLLPVEFAGAVLQDASDRTGVPLGTPVAIGTIDAYCDSLAGGIMTPASAVDVAGTSEIVSLSVAAPLVANGLFPACLAGQGCFLCGPSQSGGDTLRWLADAIYPAGTIGVDYDLLEGDACTVPAGSDGLVFLPYLSGERAPLWDSNARGALVGLALGHTRAHFTRAVYESIGYVVRHNLEIAEEAAGFQAQRLAVCGGGSQSRFWNQVKADILQRPVLPSATPHTGCLGAAMLAGVGAGVHPNLASAAQMVQFLDAIQPDPGTAKVYEQAYSMYRQYYPALSPVWSPGHHCEAT